MDDQEYSDLVGALVRLTLERDEFRRKWIEVCTDLANLNSDSGNKIRELEDKIAFLRGGFV